MTRAVAIGGRYRLEQRIGRSGIGVVWAARDRRSGRPVAVRVLERGLDEPVRVARFRAGAVAAAGLQHPGIAQVLDEGLHDGAPYVVTAWIDGEPLSSWRGRAMPPGQLLAIARHTVDALGYIHAAGLLHLDIRPGSVIVIRGADGVPRVKLIDVGCARVDDGVSERPVGARATLKFLGSLRYMAPEVAESPPWQIGPWSDFYTLGLVMWELLTGGPPHPDLDGISLLLARSREPPPPLPEGIGGPHHGALSALLMRLLSRTQSERPPTAAHVRTALEAIDAPGAWTPPGRSRRRAREDTSSPTFTGFPLARLAPGPLVGRDAERSAIWTAARAAATGDGPRLVVVTGRRGTGKTRLVVETARAAEVAGFGRHWPVRFEPERAPGDGLTRALETMLRAGRADAEGVCARVAALPLLLGVDPTGLDEVVPSLLRSSVGPTPRAGCDTDPAWRMGYRGRPNAALGTFETLIRRAAARHPVLLTLDDLQHADPETGVALVRQLLATPQLPVCVVAAVNPEIARGEVTLAALREFITSAPRRASIARLGPLPEAAAASFFRLRLALDSETARAWAHATAGDPLRMRWQADALLAAPCAPPGPNAEPPTAFEVFGERFAQLPTDGDHTLVSDVIQGFSHARIAITPRVVEVLIATDAERPWRLALAAAAREGLMVRDASGVWRFAHPSLRAWLSRRSANRAGVWHRLWRDALTTLEGDACGRWGIERAWHAEMLGDAATAAAALVEAAERALGPGLSDLAVGTAAAQRAATHADTAGDARLAVRALAAEAALHRQRGLDEEARTALDRIDVRLSERPAHPARGRAACLRSWLWCDRGAADVALDGFNQAMEHFEAAGDDTGVCWTRLATGFVALRRGDTRDARSLGCLAELAFERAGDERGHLAALWLRAQAADAAGLTEKAHDRYRALLERTRKARWPLETVLLRLHLARLELELGQADAAWEHAVRARHIAGCLDLAPIVTWLRVVAPAFAAARGDIEGARVALAARFDVPLYRCAAAVVVLRAGAATARDRGAAAIADALTSRATALERRTPPGRSPVP